MKSRTVWATAVAAALAWFVGVIASWNAPPADVRIISVGSTCVTIGCGLVAARYLRSASPIDDRMKYVARSTVWLSLLMVCVTVTTLL
ncbi:MAG: hypothetical protein JWO36_6345 [Myxococcales bacterium]|nr:hypothetical protein [Myxococcales bacterium]